MLTITRDAALHAFFTVYANEIDGQLNSFSRQELLAHLGNLNVELASDEELDDPQNYSADDIFIRLASATTGIPEHDFLVYALTYFRHD